MQNTKNQQIMKLTLNTLCELFGNHYGTSFYLLGTQISDTNLNKVMNLVDDMDPQEIHDYLNSISMFSYPTEYKH